MSLVSDKQTVSKSDQFQNLDSQSTVFLNHITCHLLRNVSQFGHFQNWNFNSLGVQTLAQEHFGRIVAHKPFDPKKLLRRASGGCGVQNAAERLFGSGANSIAWSSMGISKFVGLML